MAFLIEGLLAAIAVSAFLVGLALAYGATLRWARDAKPLSLSGEAGEMAPVLSTRSAIPALGLSGLMFLIGVIQLFQGFQLGWIDLIAGPLLAASVWPRFAKGRQVEWSAAGVTGPSNVATLMRRIKRTTISWSDIRSVTLSPHGYCLVEAHDGRRVYWSRFYKGYGALIAAIRRNCPAVGMPEALDA